MTGFTSQKIEGDTFGEMLRKRRKKLGYELDYVAQKLKIKAVYLKAIEDEDLKNLPPSVYVQGFLKHYARALGLDEEMIIKRYKTEHNILANLNPEEKLVYQSKIKKLSLLNISPKMVKVGSIILGIISFFVYLGWEFSGFSAPPVLSLVTPQDNERIDSDVLVVSGESDKEAQVFINSQEVFVDQQGNFQEQIVLSEGLNTIEIVARNKLGRERKIVRNILANLPPRNEDNAKNVNDQDKARDLNLTIRIKNSATWISVDTDGINVFQGTMLPETSQDFTAKEKITVTSGKANNTDVTFNGKEWGILGKGGEVVRNVEFTKDLKFNETNNEKN